MQKTSASSSTTTTIITAVAIGLALGGCASPSANIAASYTSPIQYQSYDCAQLESEAQRVHGLANQLAGRLDEAASNDKVLMGVGMVLFWPVLFALGGTKQQEADYARLNGEYSALQQAMIAKKCDLDARPVKAESLPQPPAVAPILPAASADVGTPGR